MFRSVSAGPSVVSVLAPLLPEAVIAMWAAAIAGVSNPINPFLEVRHIASIMNAARSTVLVTCSPRRDRAHGIRLTNSRRWCRASNACSSFITPGGGDASDDFQRALGEHRGGCIDAAASDDPDRVCAYFHTGGTTAAPKLVQHTQRGQLLNAWISAALGPPDNCGGPGPVESTRSLDIAAAPGRRAPGGEARHRRRHDTEHLDASTGITAALIRAAQSASLRTLTEIGVALAIGSDNVSDSSVLEAEHLHSLGVVDPLALLKIWTEDTPRAIFPQRRIGFLRDGYEASFLALEGSPLEDWRNIRRIKLRFKQGLEVH